VSATEAAREVIERWFATTTEDLAPGHPEREAASLLDALAAAGLPVCGPGEVPCGPGEGNVEGVKVRLWRLRPDWPNAYHAEPVGDDDTRGGTDG
jgi:hypothetical protein